MMQARTEPETSNGGVDRALWLSWLLGPLAWALHQNLSYWTVPWVCETGGYWLLHAASAAAIALAAAGGWAAWRTLRAERAASAAGPPRRGRRRRFMATAGIAVCALCVAGVVVESLPNTVLDACVGAT